MKKQDFGEEDFKKKREQFSISIRKERREQAFQRRRFPQKQSENDEEIIEEEVIMEETSGKIVIIDDRYRDEILAILEQIFTPSHFQALQQLFLGPEPLQVHRGAIGFRKLTGDKQEEDCPIIRKFTEKGLIVRSIQLIKQRQFPQLRMEAAWILANVASGPQQCCQSLIDKGMVDIFVGLLIENQTGIVDQAVMGIGNLGAESPEMRDYFLKAGAVTNLIDLIFKTQDQILQKNTIWALCNLCRGSPRPALSFVEKAIPILCRAAALQRLPLEIQSDCYTAISSMTQIKQEKAQSVIDERLLPILIKTVINSMDKNIKISSKLYVPALKIIGNMSICETLIYELDKQGLLQFCLLLLDHQKLSIRREICWIISNFLSYKDLSLKFLTHNNLKKKISEVFRNGHTDEKRQVCWILSNLAHTGKRKLVIEFFLQEEIFFHFSNLLGQKTSSFTTQCCLECLGRIFKLGEKWAQNKINILTKSFEQFGGAKKLEILQHHESKGVYNRVSSLIQKYFQIQENEMA